MSIWTLTLVLPLVSIKRVAFNSDSKSYISGFARHLAICGLGICGFLQSSHAAAPGRKVDEELENKIIDAFSNQRCDQVLDLTRNAAPELFHPTVLAVTAYCTPDKKLAETFFALAESRSPNSDTVFMLHAHYMWQSTPESAEALWQKVIFLARNPAIKKLAQEYLDGNVEDKEQISIVNPWSYYGTMNLLSGHESNPEEAAFSDSHNSSNSYGIELNANAQKTTSYGNAAVSYSLLNTRYPSDPAADAFIHDLEVPITVRADDRNDFAVRPFLSYSTLSNSAYQGTAGFAFMGIAYRGETKQLIQGFIFKDRFFKGVDSAEGGNHLRLEYNWELFRAYWFLKLQFSAEHVLADRDAVPDDNTNDLTNAVITYSHTDLGLQTNITRDFRIFSLGFFPKLLLREDSDPSTYVSASGAPTSKRRQDFQVVLQPNLTIPIDVGLQLFVWYEWNRTFSNMGPSDYQDRNVLNQTVGLSFRTFINNF